MCFLRGVHSLNNWLCPEVLSRASGLQNKSCFFFVALRAETGDWTRTGSIRVRTLRVDANAGSGACILPSRPQTKSPCSTTNNSGGLGDDDTSQTHIHKAPLNKIIHIHKNTHIRITQKYIITYNQEPIQRAPKVIHQEQKLSFGAEVTQPEYNSVCFVYGSN